MVAGGDDQKIGYTVYGIKFVLIIDIRKRELYSVTCDLIVCNESTIEFIKLHKQIQEES